VLGGKRALNPPLGLATLAALCPPHWRVTIVDENVEPLPLATFWLIRLLSAPGG
jgi:hypothetical protein